MAYSSVSLLLFLTTALTSCYGNKLGLDFHHRFSDKVREWTDSRGLPPTWNPEEVPRGTVEYYQRLLKYDLHRHRDRSLAEGDLYAFAKGNETLEYLGNLQYAFVDLGTPNQTFLVALDTGSSLFWVPCNCKQCAPNSDPSYGNIVYRNYEPSSSTTSKKIQCSSDQCITTSAFQCTNQSADCTYTIKYGAANTSSSGTLIQDDLYLIKEDITSKLVKLSILFGCGEVQTGHLLNGGPPNGLMGLGLSNISVPSMIANSGIISDSFSMCFGVNGDGQLNFGDKGSHDQNETKLNIDTNAFYNISLTAVEVGSIVSNLSFTAIVDSGTSYSRFTDDVYTKLGTSFSAQVSEQQIQVKGIPFEYCFEISENQTMVRVPPVYFTTEGGSTFRARHPAVLLSERSSKKPFAYCLAILRYGFNIIGENFLIGQRIVFDRERGVLGWKPYNCSDSENTNKPAPPPAPSTPVPPPVPSTPAPSPTIPVPSRSQANPVGCSTVISVLTSLISITLMWLPFY
ncbi:aspartic proteinase-like protein 1 [Carex littledalei]|uniref:Aspartic proteinase-like protein 1 n=1 Tax=Carex littledalei TaxID=544730 RepID=A0A833RAP4_9POAL|nr:aspartic proteinase-like protein 1 [Carex littledalei]